MLATLNLAITALNAEIVAQQDNWVVQKIKIGKHIYYGPLSSFLYMFSDEFFFIDTLFLQYEIDENESVLDTFLAALYRKQATKIGDVREKIDDRTVAKRAAHWTRVDSNVKTMILENYKLVRAGFMHRFPYIFSGSGKPKKTSSGWIGVRDMLAGDTFDYAKIDSLYIEDVLRKLNNKIKEDEQ